MNRILENFAATTKSNLQAFEGLATQAHSSFEKLAELNLAASKAALTESFGNAQSALVAKDPKEFAALQSGVFTALTEKSAAYAQHIQSIFAGTGADFTKAAEARAAESQKAIADVLANISKNAPAGTETAVAAFTSAFTTGQKAFESAQTSAKKAIEVAQSNFAAATKQTTDAVKKATKVAA
jgi:phasin family protein